MRPYIKCMTLAILLVGSWLPASKANEILGQAPRVFCNGAELVYEANR